MVKKKGKNKSMDTGDDGFTYGEPQQSGPKKKRAIKLTHKQLKRKKMKKERGEALMDRRSKKTERDAARLDKKLAAKALW